MVVQFQNDATDTVQKESVVRYHEQRTIAPLQVALQPFYHLQVQMVRRLVEYQQVRFRQQHIGQSHAFLLSSAQFPHTLLEVSYLQLRQYLLGLQHLFFFTLMVKASIEHRLIGVEHWRLFQESHFQVTPEHNVARVVALLARQNAEQRRLTRTILGNQSHPLAFTNGETDVLKQLQGTKRLAKMLYVKIRSHIWFNAQSFKDLLMLSI